MFCCRKRQRASDITQLVISLPFNFEPISRLEHELKEKDTHDLTARKRRKRACDEVVALAIVGIAKPY